MQGPMCTECSGLIKDGDALWINCEHYTLCTACYDDACADNFKHFYYGQCIQCHFNKGLEFREEWDSREELLSRFQDFIWAAYNSGKKNEPNLMESVDSAVMDPPELVNNKYTGNDINFFRKCYEKAFEKGSKFRNLKKRKLQILETKFKKQKQTNK